MKIQLTESELKNYIRQIVAESMEEETDEVLGGLGRLGGKMWNKAKNAVSNVGNSIDNATKKVKAEYQKGEEIAANNKLIDQFNKLYQQKQQAIAAFNEFCTAHPEIKSQMQTQRGGAGGGSRTTLPQQQSLMA